ncbi:TadE/TadG family type IV pilus assembly protein [Polynucleobacter sp. AP-Reno-20A-A9]|uniref:TadE/TadG family type IV pilus assembly protein n=1 Tax=Polynucleobacter sp. AP-Reno-20A-A9 TaxID=2576925 RepID=UPI001C0C7CC9|nr:TadE/TadG family type IV pilus assembly protein [Polynucleobacter sp. AP-Reno-20A-A9]MBU3628874.1 pilus assembly protein [Polynucleobacter sp. AP-Reno-20A-A9]
MTHPIIQFKRRDSGVAAVEFALILPLLMMIVFGIINYGILLYDQAVITNAAREGARWGAINTSAAISCSGTASGTADPCQIANGYTQANLITFGGATTSTSSATGAGTSGTTVTVTVSYTFTQIGWIVGSSTNALTASAVMYHE